MPSVSGEITLGIALPITPSGAPAPATCTGGVGESVSTPACPTAHQPPTLSTATPADASGFTRRPPPNPPPSQPPPSLRPPISSRPSPPLPPPPAPPIMPPARPHVPWAPLPPSPPCPTSLPSYPPHRSRRARIAHDRRDHVGHRASRRSQQAPCASHLHGGCRGECEHPCLPHCPPTPHPTKRYTHRRERFHAPPSTEPHQHRCTSCAPTQYMMPPPLHLARSNSVHARRTAYLAYCQPTIPPPNQAPPPPTRAVSDAALRPPHRHPTHPHRRHN